MNLIVAPITAGIRSRRNLLLDNGVHHRTATPTQWDIKSPPKHEIRSIREDIVNEL